MISLKWQTASGNQIWFPEPRWRMWMRHLGPGKQARRIGKPVLELDRHLAAGLLAPIYAVE
ncbi:MAG: hypothetical protein AB8I80_21905, partial [Anaerolineae bacterium]